MNRSGSLWVMVLSAALLAGACTKKDASALDRAVDRTKDALDARDHEALKDAAEDLKAAGADLQHAAKDAAADVKDAVKH